MEDFNNDELWEPAEDPQPSYYEEENTYNLDEDPYFDEDPKEKEDYDKQTSKQPTQKQEQETLDYLTKFLKNKGVDREKVRIQDDNGEIKEYKFDDLDDVTKYGILNTEDELPITDEEIDVINFLRDQEMSLPQFIELQKRQAIQEYLQQNQEPEYYTDQLSDDDLFKFDLQSKIKDLSDEDAEAQLENAKENEVFFKRRIEALRKEYKDKEDAETRAYEQQAAQQQEEAYNQLVDLYTNTSLDIEDINGMELDNEDRNEVLTFLLDRDASGQTGFIKLMNNPRKVFEMAWFALKGEEAHNALTSYWDNKVKMAERGQSQPRSQRILKRH